MSYKGFDYVLGPQLARKLPKLPPSPRRSPPRVIKTVVYVEHIESCSDPEPDTPSKASSTFIAKSKLKKKKSVHFQESKDPGSGDESELSCQSSSSCPACGRRKSILKKGGKEKFTSSNKISDKSQRCSTCGRNITGREDQKKKDLGKGKGNTHGQHTKKEQTQTQNQNQYKNRPTATSMQNSFGPLQQGTRTQQLSTRVKLHEMVQHILQPSRADVVRREDVVEQPSDPRPNAFFDQRSGLLRVYHGPTYGNPFGSLHGNPGSQSSIGTFSSTHGGGDFGYPPPYPNSPMHQFQQMNHQQQPPQNCHCQCHQCNQQKSNHHQVNFQPNCCPNTPRITSNGNPNNSKQSSPTCNHKSGGGWGGNSNGGSAPGAWVGDSINDDGGAGRGTNNNTSSGWSGNKCSLDSGESAWGNDTSNKNSTAKTKGGGDDSWNNSGDDGGSSGWGNTWGDTYQNNSGNNGTSSTRGGGNWNNDSANGTGSSNWASNKLNENSGDIDTGNSWGNNTSSGDNWNGDSGGNSGNNDVGDSWGTPPKQTSWDAPNFAQNTKGGNNSSDGDTWNSGGNSGGNNWGDNSGGGNNGGAWGTETALSGGSWADGGTGPTHKNFGW